MSQMNSWDWERSFRMHEAAALIAGVPVSPKRHPDTEELHADARPVLVRLLTAWAVGVNYKKGEPVSPDYPESQTLLAEELHPTDRLVSIFVKRSELRRWIEAMGLPSAYDFSEPALKAERTSVSVELLKPVTGPAEPDAETAPQPVPVLQTEAVATVADAFSPRPVPRQAYQEQAILRLIRDEGHDPLKLPKNEPGKPGIKAKVRMALQCDPIFTGATVFEKAWERLRNGKEIADQP